MSGKFTRLRYDTEAYLEELERSTEPLMYMLDPNFANSCQKCFAPYGPRDAQPDSVAVGNQTDIDSILRNYNKINTKSNFEQQATPVRGYQLTNLPDCSPAMESEHTRLSYPAYELKGLTTRDLNLSYPLFDPQCQIFENFAVDTRLQAKDNHRSVWQVPFGQPDLNRPRRLGQVSQCGIGKDCQYSPWTRSN